MVTGPGRTFAVSMVLLAAVALAGCTAPPPRGIFARSATPPDPPPIPERRPVATAPIKPKAVAVNGTAAGAPPKSTLIGSQGGSQGAAPNLVGLPVYVVRRKDTVYAISRRFDVPIRGMIDYNTLVPPYTLSIGQRLRIPVKRRHTIAKGETVYGISRTYGVDLTELVRLNRLGSPYTIKPAQFLVIPVPPLGAVAGKTNPAVSPSGQKGRQIANASPRQAPRAIPRPPPRSSSKFLWPVKGRIILGFGPKSDGRHNDGINIEAPRGAPVRAAENGVVAYAGNELRGFGNLLLIKHSGGWVTAYAHTDKVLVRRGQTVKRGQTVGQVGTTGNVARPQLHFEVRKGTRAVNPAGLLGPLTANLN